MLGALGTDVRYGLRLMRRSPTFTLTAIVVLSLGIGVNTALFSIVNSLFNRDLHVRAQEQLFYIFNILPSGQEFGMMDRGRSDLLRNAARDLAEFTLATEYHARVSIDENTQSLSGGFVTRDYFEFLGVPLALGRGFRAEDDNPGNPELSIVIGHDLWMKQFNGRADVIGHRVRVADKFYQVIGVASRSFSGLSSPLDPQQFWITGTQATGSARWGGGLVGRLKPGATVDQIRALVAARMPSLLEETWKALPEWRDRYPNYLRGPLPVYKVTDLDDPSDPKAKLIPTNVLAALTTVVGLVLLIATTNIAGLLLARGITRTGEVAVRQALGAGRGRLVRQILTESVLLSGAGGILGAGLGAVLVRIFSALTPSTLAIDVTVDGRVLLFAILVCVGSGVLVGMAPAVQAAKVNVLEALGSGLVGSRRTGAGLRRWIVVPQVAFALVLLLVAAVHVRTLSAIELSDLGYRTSGSIVFAAGRWGPPRGRFTTNEAYWANQAKEAAAARAFNQAALDRVKQIPGVESAAMTTGLPLQSFFIRSATPVIERDAYFARVGSHAGATRQLVSDDYFNLMSMRLLRGRTFDGRDQFNGKRTAVISEALARALWPTTDPIGQTLAFLSDNTGQQLEWLEVIGIVNDVDPVLRNVGEWSFVYLSIAQEWNSDPGYVLVRGRGDQAALIRGVKDAILGADTFAEVTRVQTMDQMVGEILYPRRLAAGILSVAGLIGLTLACIGLYGIVSYAAAQRQRELGIRATLGAGKRDLVRLVLSEGAGVVTVGIAGGLILAVIALRVTAGVVPDLPSIDPAAFVLVPFVLVGVVLAACFLPALRAANIDPARVLRGD